MVKYDFGTCMSRVWGAGGVVMVVEQISEEAGVVVQYAAIVMLDRCSFSMKVWEEVCEDEVENYSAIDEYY